jgi:hypothetical protein
MIKKVRIYGRDSHHIPAMTFLHLNVFSSFPANA